MNERLNVVSMEFKAEPKISLIIRYTHGHTLIIKHQRSTLLTDTLPHFLPPHTYLIFPFEHDLAATSKQI